MDFRYNGLREDRALYGYGIHLGSALPRFTPASGVTINAITDEDA